MQLIHVAPDADFLPAAEGTVPIQHGCYHNGSLFFAPQAIKMISEFGTEVRGAVG